MSGRADAAIRVSLDAAYGDVVGDASAAPPSDARMRSDAGMEVRGVDAGDGAAESDAGRSSLTVEIESGLLEGALDHGARVFLGVPYAAPPVGPLRFAPPQPTPHWAGTRAAKSFGLPCIQAPNDVEGPYSEDCLTLNVFTPEVAGSWPVMLYLHGGGNVMGSGSAFPAQWLSAPHGVVVVTINYRLAALGNLVHPALDRAVGQPSGNLGLRDQLHALRWVKNNISAFGGDPSSVTVFGESYGGASACVLMLVREARTLAHRFIMQSNTCLPGGVAGAPPLSRDASVEISRRLIDRLCPSSSDVVSCLRTQPAEAFAPTLLEIMDWRPYVDGKVVERTSEEHFASGDVHPGEVIVGTNAHEWRTFADLLSLRPGTRLEMELLTRALYPKEADELLAEYAPDRDEAAAEAFSTMQTDADFRCPTLRFARTVAALGNAVYLYHFEVPPAAHAFELDYVFGWPSGGVGASYPGEAPTPSLSDVVAATQGYWTDFAKSGDPNGPGRVTWQRFLPHRPWRVRLRSPVVSDGKRDERCVLWETVRTHQEVASARSSG